MPVKRSNEWVAVPDRCPRCGESVQAKSCSNCRVYFGPDRRELRQKPPIILSLSRDEIRELRKTYMREPDGIQFFMYHFFSKAQYHGRLPAVTYEECLSAVRRRFPEFRLKKDTFEAYYELWMKQYHTAKPPEKPADPPAPGAPAA